MHITFLLQLGRKCATLLCESDPRNIPSSIIAFLKAQRLESSQSKRLPWIGNNEINNLHIIKEIILSWQSGKDKTIFYLPLPKVRLWDWNYYEVVEWSSLTPSNFLSSSSQGINGQLCHILQLVVSLTKIYAYQTLAKDTNITKLSPHTNTTFDQEKEQNNSTHD